MPRNLFTASAAERPPMEGGEGLPVPPQGAGLEIDETLTLLERVERFSTSGASVQRLVHVREIAACAEEVGATEALSRIVPLLKIISTDPDVAVRETLVEQIVPLARVLLSEPDVQAGRKDGTAAANGSEATAKECVLRELVPLLTSLLSSGSQDASGNSPGLSEAAAEALLELAALIDAGDVGDTVLREVLCLAHDNEVEEHRVVATQLLGSLAPVLGYDLCCQYVLPELVCLADDPAFRVRKAAALRVGAVSTVVGPELTVGRLLPIFEVLARDEIWGVRKASVESLAEVSAVMPLEVRTGQLEKLMHEFHVDSSRWVRISACQALGPFIATLPADAISSALLEQFTQLANPSNPTAADSDVAYSCAYNFPGVAQAVGRERWADLAEAFGTLASNIQWKVRRTLSCSLHDIAAILGPELSESALLPTFDLFIKDLDEVKVGVIQHLAAFVGCLLPETRLQYLPILGEVRAETDNWRFRQLLASQLAEFGAAYDRAATLDTLLPLAFSLCTDSVAEVRQTAIGQVGKLLQPLALAAAAVPPPSEEHPLSPESEAYKEAEETFSILGEFVDTIVSMARAPSCHKRANCVQICASLLEGLPPPISLEKVLPALLPIVTDRVANVRLALATLVRGRLLAESSPFVSHPMTQQMLAALREDTDRDVLRQAHADVEGYEPPRYPYRCPKRSDRAGLSPSSATRAVATHAATDAAADVDDGFAGGLPSDGSAADLAEAVADEMGELNLGTVDEPGDR